MIQVPSLALERARMELGHMSQLTSSMLAEVKSAFSARDLTNLSQRFDQVVVLRDAVLAYLQHVGRSELSDSEAEEHARLVAATGEIEGLAAAISRDLAPMAQALVEAEITPSRETADLLDRLLQAIVDAAQSALRAVVESDQQAAQTVVARRGAILALSADLQRQQAQRLAQDDPNILAKHRVQVEILDRLRRIYSASEHMAVSVLPRSVLAGELYS
jgi:phosphate:Na+ symporter